MRQWIALIALLVTVDQLRSAECRVACGFVGYESGGYWQNKCYCVDFKVYSDITNRHPVYLPKKSKGRALVSPSYSDPPKESAPSYRGYPKELDEFLF